MTAEMTPTPYDARLSAIATFAFELVPLASVDTAIAGLPPASTVSITCSPTKGIAATRDITDRVRSLGHTVVPHLAARMVASRAEAGSIARWLRDDGIEAAFVVGGDAERPHGPYHDGIGLLRDLLAADPGLRSVGVPSYPDGHPIIGTGPLDQALRDKQDLLAEAGLAGWTSTQMCFDPERIVAWAEQERAGGLTLPIHLGLPGVVERAKLMTMGMRLGVGASMRYLRKNHRAVGRLLTRSDYDPDDLLVPLASELARLGITGVHCFTFNQVEATARWRRLALEGG